MKFKLSGLGLLSVFIYAIFILIAFRFNLVQLSYVSRMYDSQMISSILTYAVSALSVIPTLDFLIKAFKKHYRHEEYSISTLSVILTVLSFGAPLFAYAFISLMMKMLFGSQEEYDIEKYGFIVGTVLSLGLIWVGIFFILGPTLFAYRKIIDGIYLTEEPSPAEGVSLLLATIFTLGLVWIGILINIVLMRFFFVKGWNIVMNSDNEVEPAYIVFFIIISIITLGLAPLGALMSYWQIELFLNNVEDQIV